MSLKRYGQLEIVVSGVAPIVTTETTLNTNFNADMVDGCHVNDAGTTTSDVWTANKIISYVAAQQAAKDWKESVRVATTAAGTLATDFENGDTIDGVVLATGDRILLKNQATGAENGIHTVNTSGAPTRADDLAVGDSAANVVVCVEEGTTNADTSWHCTNNEGSDVVGTDALVFTSFGGSGEINTASNVGTDGVGVFYQKSGVDLQFRHVAPGSSKITTTLNGQDIDIDVVEANLTHDNIGGNLGNTKGGSRMKVGQIGDGVATYFDINHAFSSKNVDAWVYKDSDGSRDHQPSITLTDTDNLRFDFGSYTPSSNEFRYVIQHSGREV